MEGVYISFDFRPRWWVEQISDYQYDNKQVFDLSQQNKPGSKYVHLFNDLNFYSYSHQYFSLLNTSLLAKISNVEDKHKFHMRNHTWRWRFKGVSYTMYVIIVKININIYKMTFDSTYSWTTFLLNSSSALQMLCYHIKM